MKISLREQPSRVRLRIGLVNGGVIALHGADNP
jgi:hypothetical protein